MQSGGKWVIFGIFVIAIAATTFAWWFRKTESQQVLKFWGGETASRIRRAEEIWLLELVAVSKDEEIRSEVIHVQNQEFTISKRTEISHQRGLIHARAALVSDSSFDWDRSPEKEARWEFAWEFRLDSKATRLAFDLNSAQVMDLERGQPAALGEKITLGLKTLMEEIRKSGS